MKNSTYIFYGSQLPIYLSVDPLTEQTMTPYQYTYQNPVRYIDPTGMAAVDNDWDNPVYGSDGGSVSKLVIPEFVLIVKEKNWLKMVLQKTKNSNIIVNHAQKGSLIITLTTPISPISTIR